MTQGETQCRPLMFTEIAVFAGMVDSGDIFLGPEQEALGDGLVGVIRREKWCPNFEVFHRFRQSKAGGMKR